MTTHNQKLMISFTRKRLSLLVLALMALAIGCCRDTADTDGPAPSVDTTAEESDEDRLDVVKASVEHLKIARVINRWGREPEVDWPAVITLGEMCKLAYDDAPTRQARPLSSRCTPAWDLMFRGEIQRT